MRQYRWDSPVRIHIQQVAGPCDALTALAIACEVRTSNLTLPYSVSFDTEYTPTRVATPAQLREQIRQLFDLSLATLREDRTLEYACILSVLPVEVEVSSLSIEYHVAFTVLCSSKGDTLLRSHILCDGGAPAYIESRLQEIVRSGSPPSTGGVYLRNAQTVSDIEEILSISEQGMINVCKRKGL